jgi:ATP-dependent Clp protease protease subunit
VKFWNILVNSEGIPVLYLYGPIANDSWWGDEVTPKQFADELQAHKDATELHVRINSPGGDVFAGVAIYNLLRQFGKPVTTINDGMCASAATLPLMAGDTRLGSPGTMVMVHQAMKGTFGNKEAHKKAIALLEKCEDCIRDAYARTGLDAETLTKLMDEETYMSGHEALSNGFLTEVIEYDPSGVQNCAAFSYAAKKPRSIDIEDEEENLENLPQQNANGTESHPEPVTDTITDMLKLKLKLAGF